MVRAPFRVLRAIGRGGMAEVVLAESAEGTRVALKRVLRDHASDARFRRMFLDEARIASALDHPGVVRVLGSGEEEGAPWIAMEPIDGSDAASWCEQARALGVRLPGTAALRIAADLAHALDHAHSARAEDGSSLGIVHRDVSPSNVLIAREGTVKLGDFGIAKARDRLERTSAGSTKGKLAYMAPEQMLGSEVDRRTDVFGLGCTLHALVTGRSAVQDETDAATLIAGSELPLAPDLDPDVRAIVARAVAPSRAKRFASAGAMAAAIEEAIAARGEGDGRAALRAWIAAIDRGEERRAESATRPERASPRTRARTGIAIAIAAAAAIAIGATVWSGTGSGTGTGTGSGTGTGTGSGEPVSATGTDVAAGAASDTAPAIATASGIAGATEGTPHVASAHAATVTVSPASAAVATAHATEREHAEPASARVTPRAVPAPAPVAVPVPAPAPGPDPDPDQTGVLVVGGPGAVDAVVFVDGRRIDFAPATVEVAVGSHDVQIRDASGVVIASRGADVRADHTRRSPSRVIFP